MQSAKESKSLEDDQKIIEQIASNHIANDSDSGLRSLLEKITEDGALHQLLMLAVWNKSYKCLETLIDHGVSPINKLKEDEQPISVAVVNDDSQALKILTKNGLTTEHHKDEELQIELYLSKRILCRALYQALTENKLDCMPVLIEFIGSSNLSGLCLEDFNEQLSFFTPLMIACDIPTRVSETPCMDGGKRSILSRRLDIVKMLIQKGRVDVNTQNYAGKTALMCAANSGEPTCVRLLLENGARVNAVDRCHRSALIFAVSSASTSIMQVCRMLLDAGCDVNVFDVVGMSALDIAISHSNVELVELLLSYGAIVDTTNPKYNRYEQNRRNPTDAPLYSAVVSGNRDLVRILLRWGVDVNHAPALPTSRRSGCLILTRLGVRHSQASTPFRYALEVGNYRVARMLLAAGHCRTRARQIVESMLMEMCSGLFASMLSIDGRGKQKALEDLHEEVCRVQQLRQFCRLTIRRRVEDMRRLNQLPLPESIISYLWMNDL